MSRLQAAIAVTAVLMVFAMSVYLFVAIIFWQNAKASETPKERVRFNLPAKCQPYYNDGTERWINCMGVGKK